MDKAPIPPEIRDNYKEIFNLLDELKIKKAQTKINKLLKETKNDPFLFWLKGYIFLYDGTENFEDAIECFDKAIRIDPDNAFAWEFKAIALRSVGRYEEAIQCYEKSLEFNPLDYSAIYNKALLLERIGKTDEALDYYTLATKIDPKNNLAWESMADLLENLERFDEAEKCRSKIYKEYPSRIVENEPSTPEEWVHKGETLEKLGKYLWANQCYDMALKIDENHQKASDLKYMLMSKRRLEIEAKKNTQRHMPTEKSFI
ncbi:MAG: tetratricopeptide repeat protein [Candidatus Methanofastidiosa archaeon]|jgi:tetratricopeptide (TPR) repeat protein|nr:tetratricopeptide repeat protein [Candidatus Methanofastidiosa archaeon]